MLGHGGLGEMQRLGGVGKRGELGHLGEDLELAEIHGGRVPKRARRLSSGLPPAPDSSRAGLGGLHQGLGQRRMGVDRRGDVLGHQRGLDGQRALGDQLSRARARRCRRRARARTRVGHELGEAVGAAERGRASRGGPRERGPPSPPDRRAAASLSRHPAPRDLGIGEDHRGDRRRCRTRPGRPGDDLRGHLALAHRAVGEHRLAGDVADGEEVRVGRAAALVDRDDARARPTRAGVASRPRPSLGGAPAHRHEHAVEPLGPAA